jgi:hypothetical protein
MSNYFETNDLFLEPKVKQYGSHMIMTNVHKQSKTKYINIDTRFRDEYNYTEIVNYNLTLPERINDIKKMKIKSIELPMTMYNISEALGNNYFKVTIMKPVVDGEVSSAMIIIPDNQYTKESLIAVIKDKILNIGSNNLNYLQYDIIGNHAMFYRFFKDGANSSEEDYNLMIEFAVDKYGNFDKYNFKSKLGWLLGYRDVSYIITIKDFDNNIPNYTISESFIDLNVTKYLYLAMDEYTKSNPNSFITTLPTSFINKSIIAKICLDKSRYDFNSILTANLFNGLLISDERTYSGKIDLQKLNIQVLNEFGNPISLNGMDFSLCIEVEHE